LLRTYLDKLNERNGWIANALKTANSRDEFDKSAAANKVDFAAVVEENIKGKRSLYSRVGWHGSAWLIVWRTSLACSTRMYHCGCILFGASCALLIVLSATATLDDYKNMFNHFIHDQPTVVFTQDTLEWVVDSPPELHLVCVPV